MDLKAENRKKRKFPLRPRGIFAAAAILLALTILTATACSLPTSADSTTITADEFGKVSETIVEARTGDFNEEELREFIEYEVASFNALHEAGAVTLESCKVSGNSVRIKMNYLTWVYYSEFNHVNCFQGTLRQAEEEGYDLDLPFYDSAGTEANADTLRERSNEWKVIIVEEPISVKVPDKILYASDNVTITGRLSADVNTVLSEEHQDSEYSEYAHVSDRNAYIIYK